MNGAGGAVWALQLYAARRYLELHGALANTELRPHVADKRDFSLLYIGSLIVAFIVTGSNAHTQTKLSMFLHIVTCLPYRVAKYCD